MCNILFNYITAAITATTLKIKKKIYYVEFLFFLQKDLTNRNDCAIISSTYRNGSQFWKENGIMTKTFATTYTTGMCMCMRTFRHAFFRCVLNSWAFDNMLLTGNLERVSGLFFGGIYMLKNFTALLRANFRFGRMCRCWQNELKLIK